MLALPLLLLMTSSPARSAGASPDRVFRFHLFTEPSGLDPVVNRGASGNYLYHSLYRGLMSYRSDEGLRPAGAKACVRRGSRRLVCTLDDRHRWSTGERVRAGEYVRRLRRVIDPAIASPHADLLFSLRGARRIQRGEAKPETLGVTARDDRTLEFNFTEADGEFEHKLVHPALAPEPPGGFPKPADAAKLVTNGTYRIAEWRAESRARLVANPALPGAADRPVVEVLFVDEDTTALSLFEAGKLSLLRRLIASEIPRFAGDPRLHRVPQARFDYLGFGPALAARFGLRDALVESVDYAQFLKLFDTRTPPGCISLPRRYLGDTACFAFTPARLAVRRSEFEGSAPNLEFHFSQMGGDDIRRAAEWFAGQWKKNLGVSTSLRSHEQGAYLGRLRADPPAIFRKGVSLDRPTCLAALELFEVGHPENYARLDDGPLNALVERLRRTTSDAERRRLCRRGVERLMATRRVLPLGEMHFTLLVDPRFSGWDLNEINQLDLSRLVLRLGPGL